MSDPAPPVLSFAPSRPRFRLEVPERPDDVHRRLRAQLACSRCPCRIQVRSGHVEIMIRDELRHFGSPRLSLEIEEHAGGSVLHGHFGPNPDVWTLFLAAYGFLGLSALFAGGLGLVQLSLGLPAWGLWVAGASLLACALPYAGSLVGQRVAAEQMLILRCFLEESLGLAHERAASHCPVTRAAG